MKALAGMLLAVALAVGIGSEASAQQCLSNKSNAKHVTKHRGKLAKSNTKKKSQPLCLCKLTHKKKHRTGVMKTGTYAGYMPETPPTVISQESDMFPVNPLPVPQGEWDNTGQDLRRYPPQSHVIGDVNTNTNSNTNTNQNWLESTELQNNQQQPQQPVLQNPGRGKQMPTQQQMPEQVPTEQPKNQ